MILQAVGIAEQKVRYILHWKSSMEKLCARTMLHFSNAKQKVTRKWICQQSLERFEKNPFWFITLCLRRKRIRSSTSKLVALYEQKPRM